MPANTFTQWQKLTPFQVGDPGTPAALPPMMPFYRNIIDRRLAGNDPGFNAVEDYPDGYLGTITNRREAKSFPRSNVPGYQRGVHKGSKIEPSEYEWPPDQDPLRGIQAEARGLRHAPRGGPGVQPFVGAHLVNSGKWMPRGAEEVIQVNSSMRANLAPLVPPWK